MSGDKSTEFWLYGSTLNGHAETMYRFSLTFRITCADKSQNGSFLRTRKNSNQTHKNGDDSK